MKKTILYTLLILLFATTAFILKPSNNNEIQNIKLRQKRFEVTFNQQMEEIRKKQAQIIKAYDLLIIKAYNLIISNRVEHIEK